MKYIIVGASAAGLACAEQLRETDKKGEIILITQEKYLPYSRPSISYYLKGKVTQRDMLLRKPSYYKSKAIQIITDTQVTAIDTKKKCVKAGRKTLPYDKLCLCTGSVPFIPPMKNVKGKENALTFLDLEATKKLKAAANKNTRAVVIGAGLIGMKAAEGLSKVCKSVDVVELSPRILPSILDEKSSLRVKKYVQQKGNITFHLGDTVSEAKSKGNTINAVVLNSSKELECDLLVVAVGVRPETSLAEKAGLKVDRGIITDAKTMQTSDKNSYAAGDCVVSTDMLDGSEKIIALWVNAVKQGRVAGSQMAGGTLTLDGSFAVNAIDFYGLRICTCGLINAKGDEYKEKIIEDENSYKRLIIRDNRLVGFVLINSGENAGIYTSLIENKTDLRELEGDITSAPTPFMFDYATRQKKLKGETNI